MLKHIPFFLLAVLFSGRAEAFPELIRHGYVNCNTCHVSPAGGGALIDYGRTFSGEGLSTWSRKDEESIFNGLVPRSKIPEWLILGGDARAVQTYRESDLVKEGKFIFMQADFEAAARLGAWTFDVTAGRYQPNPFEEPSFKTRRYFAMYNFSDQWMLRAGRFIPTYGINLADHIIATRQPLGFMQFNETHNVELSWITDTWSAVVSAIKGPVDSPASVQETAEALQIAYAFLDTYKVGINAWNGKSEAIERQMAGVHALLGFTEQFYFLGEIDRTWNYNLASKAYTHGMFSYGRLGYEILHGLHLIATGEYWQTNMNNGATATDRYGVGSQWFPRPHFDFQLLFTEERKRSVGDKFENYAWIVGHYYF